jgi:hypothetical protein
MSEAPPAAQPTMMRTGRDGEVWAIAKPAADVGIDAVEVSWRASPWQSYPTSVHLIGAVIAVMARLSPLRLRPRPSPWDRGTAPVHAGRVALMRTNGSLRFDIGRADHLGPFLGVFS